jgi:TonB family protein
MLALTHLLQAPVVHALTLYLLVATAFAPATRANEYVPAKLIDRPTLRYPEESQKRGNEGLIIYRYKVDRSGNAGDVTISYSTGDTKMERQLRNWVRQHKFEPATVAGRRVESYRSGQATFLLTQRTRGASRKFVRQWKEFSNDIGNGDISSAERRIEKITNLEDRSLYEELYLQRAWTVFHASNGDLDAAYDHLRAIAGFYAANTPKEETIAPASTFFAPLKEKYKYEVSRLMIGDAKQTLEALHEIDSEAEETKALESHFASVLEAIRGKTFLTDGIVQPTQYSGGEAKWSLQLTRNKFSIEQVDGHLESVNVFCDGGGLVNLDTTPSTVFETTGVGGSCELVVTGDVGTEFAVSQFADG